MNLSNGRSLVNDSVHERYDGRCRWVPNDAVFFLVV